MTSVADFFGMSKAESFEEELVKVVIKQVVSNKDNLLQVSRIRTAWRAARVQITKAEQRKTTGSSEDLEEPLDETLQEELYQSRDDRHHFKLDMFTTPSDLLIGRLYRYSYRGEEGSKLGSSCATPAAF